MSRTVLTGLDWLYARMEELGLESIEDAARRCNLNRGTLYRYFALETRPSIDVLPRLCKGLDAPPFEVLRALQVQLPHAEDAGDRKPRPRR